MFSQSMLCLCELMLSISLCGASSASSRGGHLGPGLFLVRSLAPFRSSEKRTLRGTRTRSPLTTETHSSG